MTIKQALNSMDIGDRENPFLPDLAVLGRDIENLDVYLLTDVAGKEFLS
ncbi:hypothetical protein [Pseudanabaena yagii]|nr:hypothetical protein [Pseudanabaena yagii]